MKKKIGELTLKEIVKKANYYCQDGNCSSKCPLYKLTDLYCSSLADVKEEELNQEIEVEDEIHKN